MQVVAEGQKIKTVSANIPSSSEGTYRVTLSEYFGECECKGFAFRKSCKHVQLLRQMCREQKVWA